MSVRPPPAMRVNCARAGGGIGRVEIDWIVFPTTSTFDGSDNRGDWPSKMRTFSISTAVCGTAGSAATATVATNAQAKVKNVRGVFGLFTTVSPHDLRAKRLQLADRRMAGEQKLPEGPAAYRMRVGQAKSQRELGAPESKTAPLGPFASIRW